MRNIKKIEESEVQLSNENVPNSFDKKSENLLYRKEYPKKEWLSNYFTRMSEREAGIMATFIIISISAFCVSSIMLIFMSIIHSENLGNLVSSILSTLIGKLVAFVFLFSVVSLIASALFILTYHWIYDRRDNKIYIISSEMIIVTQPGRSSYDYHYIKKEEIKDIDF